MFRLRSVSVAQQIRPALLGSRLVSIPNTNILRTMASVTSVPKNSISEAVIIDHREVIPLSLQFERRADAA